MQEGINNAIYHNSMCLSDKEHWKTLEFQKEDFEVEVVKCASGGFTLEAGEDVVSTASHSIYIQLLYDFRFSFF